MSFMQRTGLLESDVRAGVTQAMNAKAKSKCCALCFSTTPVITPQRTCCQMGLFPFYIAWEVSQLRPGKCTFERVEVLSEVSS
jgi:hypothetical protein